MTGVEIVFGNCLPAVYKIARFWEQGKNPIMVDDASCHLFTLVAICLVIPQRMCLSGTVMEIWRLKDNGVTTLTFWGYVTL